MKSQRPYEIQTLPDGSIQIIQLDNNQTFIFNDGEIQTNQFCETYYNHMAAAYPYHIAAIESMLFSLDTSIAQLRKFPRKYRARIVEQSLKCLFGNIDHVPDCDENGTLHFEKVACPIRNRCKYDGYSTRNRYNKYVVCNPVRSNGLHHAELDVARLLAQPALTIPEIAERRNVSPNTICNQRKTIFRKLGVHNRRQLSEIVRTQRLG